MAGSLFFQDTDVTQLLEKVQQIPRAENEIVLLLIGENTPINIQALSAAFKQAGIPVVGGVFPGVIYGSQKFEIGIVADVLPLAAKPTLITGLETYNFNIGSLPPFPAGSQYTALIMVDGLTKYISMFLDRLFRKLGDQVRYIGGGAGSLSFQQKPCLFDNEGVYQDAALLVWLKTNTHLGIRHGWQQLRGPFIATQTEGTVVQQLNRKPAFQVYSEVIKTKTGETLTHENFFSIAKGFPLGIYHPAMDYIVRDPISFTEEGSLVCVGEIPARSMVYVLQGDKKSLIDHAELATSEAKQNGDMGQHHLIVDCISRVLYLEEEFGKELSAVLNALPDNAPTPFGMLSLGEIATFATGKVEFFNKTIVVGSLHHTA